jgi:putative ABC transport system substrate-binding protein
MNRREFITLLGGAAAAWPLAARAQQARKVYHVGVLVPFPASVLASWFDELRQVGFIQGQNLMVNGRGYASSYEQISAIAAELVSARPDAIVCAGDEAIRAAQTATQTIPIVASTDDMVGSGLVRSLSLPGGNTTGVSLLAAELDGKRQELLIEMLPTAGRMAVLGDVRTTAPPSSEGDCRRRAPAGHRAVDPLGRPPRGHRGGDRGGERRGRPSP